jgi:GTP pyrophosphokinase
MGRTNWEEPNDPVFIEQILVPAWRVMLDEELQHLRLAYDLCKYGHSQDTPPRKTTGEPYYVHPMAVARIVLDEVQFVDPKLVYIAFLHDVLEDTGLFSVHHLQMVFGRKVAQAVKILSKNDFVAQIRDGYITREESDRIYFQRFYDGDNWRATTVKLADRLHNLRTAKGLPKIKLTRLRDTTAIHVYPLIDVAIEQAPRLKRQRVRDLGDLVKQECSQIS